MKRVVICDITPFGVVDTAVQLNFDEEFISHAQAQIYEAFESQ